MPAFLLQGGGGATRRQTGRSLPGACLSVPCGGLRGGRRCHGRSSQYRLLLNEGAPIAAICVLWAISCGCAMSWPLPSVCGLISAGGGGGACFSPVPFPTPLPARPSGVITAKLPLPKLSEVSFQDLELKKQRNQRPRNDQEAAQKLWALFSKPESKFSSI